MLVAKAKELLGSPDQWNRDNLKELGHLVAGLLPSELRKIGDQVIKDSLQFLKNVDLNLDQVFLRSGCELNVTITLASVTSIRNRRVGRGDTLRVVFNLGKRQNSGKNTRARARSRVYATRGSVTLARPLAI